MQASPRPIPDNTGRKPAPGDLWLVQDFVNTLDVDDGLVQTELLPDVAALASWLRDHGLLEAGGDIGEPELRQAIAVREALRALLLANNGGRPDPPPRPTVHRPANGPEV